MKRGVVGRLRYSMAEHRQPRSVSGWLRLLWADFVIHPLFEDGERCEDCGRGYVLWRAPDDLWHQAMGGGGGLLCPGCFDQRLVEGGLRGGVIFLAEPLLPYHASTLTHADEVAIR